MLEDLHIENYALIDSLTLEFSKGMNTLTGETGAGKSILAGALGLLLGAKATTSVIRTGCERAMVSGTFVLPSHGQCRTQALAWLDEQGIDAEDDRVVIRRVLKSTGKGNAYIQGGMLPRQKLEEFTAILLDMHGQHEHQSLFNIQNHRRLIDAYGNLEEQVQQIQRNFLYLNEKREELNILQKNERDRLREIELLKYAVKEIEDMKVQPGEDDVLEAERMKLQQYEQLYSQIEIAHQALHEDEGGAMGLLYSAMNALKKASGVDASQKDTASRMESLYYELEDIFSQISSYIDGLNYDPQRIEFIEERLADLTSLRKKYGPRLEDVLDYANEAADKLERFTNSGEYASSLQKEIQQCENNLSRQAKELSTRRKEAARALEAEVTKSIAELGMPKAKFAVSFSQRLNDAGVPVCGPSGIDRVEFMLSANQGEKLRALKDIASGGEISRVMLAIKTALAESDDIPTLVFDEIDTGIGGEVGRALGEHLQSLSKRKQILCITHLASIAAHAYTHIQVKKSEEGERTRTLAVHIDGPKRIEEIARMLSGDANSPASLEHARQLLQSAAQ